MKRTTSRTIYNSIQECSKSNKIVHSLNLHPANVVSAPTACTCAGWTKNKIMFKSNTTLCITYRDPHTFALRGELRVRWSDKDDAFIVSLWKYRGCLVAMSYFRNWEGVKSYIERVEDLSKTNSAFLAIAKRLLADYCFQFAMKPLWESHN